VHIWNWKNTLVDPSVSQIVLILGDIQKQPRDAYNMSSNWYFCISKYVKDVFMIITLLKTVIVFKEHLLTPFFLIMNLLDAYLDYKDMFLFVLFIYHCKYSPSLLFVSCMMLDVCFCVPWRGAHRTGWPCPVLIQNRIKIIFFTLLWNSAGSSPCIL